jgi:hypothetical protein
MEINSEIKLFSHRHDENRCEERRRKVAAENSAVAWQKFFD